MAPALCVIPMLCLASCISAGSPVVVEEPLQPARVVKSARAKAKLRVFDRSCDADSGYDPGCALGSLPIFELAHCEGADHAAMPVVVLPPDVHPYDCSVEVRSTGQIPFTFDPGWRSTCVARGDGTHECSGVPAYASLSGDEELDPPAGVQAVLTVRCAGFEDEARPLVMSAKPPLQAAYAAPVCTSEGNR